MSTTYKIQFTGPRISAKRFADARSVIKQAGGTYDEPTKTWTIVDPGPKTVTRGCYDCGCTGKTIIPGTEYCTTYQASGRPCTYPGRHAHSADICPACDGAGETTGTQSSKERSAVTTVEDSYGAKVTMVDDGGRAALEQERRRLRARLAEIGRLLGDEEA